MPLPTCEKVKKDFKELKSIWRDFEHELKNFNLLSDSDIIKEQRKNIAERLVLIRESVDIWLDPNQIELRRELAKKGNYSFVGAPNEAGTFLAEKAGQRHLINSEGKVLRELYSWKSQGSSMGVSAWQRKKDSKIPGVKNSVITFVDQATGKILGDYKTDHQLTDFSEGKGVVVEPVDNDPNAHTFEYISTNGKRAFRHPIGDFSKAIKFSEDRAVVSFRGTLSNIVGYQGGNRGDDYFIDENGKQIGDKKYKCAFGFSEGLAVVLDGDGFYYIDRNCQPVFEHRIFESAGSFKNGFAAVRINGLYGFINKQGELVVDCKYNNVNDFHEGRAVAWKTENGKKLEVVLDEDGNELALIESNVLGGSSGRENIFSNGFLVVSLKLDMYVFCGRDGKIVFNKKFSRARSFSDGRARVSFDNPMHEYFIDTNGEVIAGPFSKAEDFEGGVAKVRHITEGIFYREFYIDKNGKEIFQ